MQSQMTQMLEKQEQTRAKLLGEIQELKKEITSLRRSRVRKMSDGKAEAIIRAVVLEVMKEKHKIGILELMTETKLPPQQINRIMEKLEQEGVVTEDD